MTLLAPSRISGPMGNYQGYQPIHFHPLLSTACPPPDYIHLEGDNSEGLPPAKRPRYFETHNEPNTSTYCAYAALDTSTAEEDDEDPEDGADPESYYTLTPADGLAQEVKAFIGATFRRSIPKRKRLEIANEYPKPDMPATKVYGSSFQGSQKQEDQALQRRLSS